MNKLLAVLVAGTFAAMSISALAQPAKTDDSMKKDPMATDAKAKKKADFKAKQEALQSEATNKPATQPVDKSAKAANPVPKGKMTKDEKKANFKASQATMQKESSNAPTTAPADKSAAKLSKDEKKAVSKEVGKGAAGQ